MNMGLAIKELREEKQVPMWKLAQMTNYKASALYKIEKRPLLFYLEPLYTIADALSVKVSDLMKRAEEL
jgi:transcriptional regulator with XRE-family HTH domain